MPNPPAAPNPVGTPHLLILSLSVSHPLLSLSLSPLPLLLSSLSLPPLSSPIDHLFFSFTPFFHSFFSFLPFLPSVVRFTLSRSTPHRQRSSLLDGDRSFVISSHLIPSHPISLHLMRLHPPFSTTAKAPISIRPQLHRTAAFPFPSFLFFTRFCDALIHSPPRVAGVHSPTPPHFHSFDSLFLPLWRLKQLQRSDIHP